VAVFRSEAKIQWRESKGHLIGAFFFERIELFVEIIVLAAAPLPFLDGIDFYFSNAYIEEDVLINQIYLRPIIMLMNSFVYLWPLELYSTLELH